MSNLPRKTLMITIRNACKPKDDDCDDHLPPSDNHHPLSPLKIMMICTLAAAISFICYIVIIKTCRVFKSRWRRRIIRSHGSTNSNQTRHDFIDVVHENHEDHEPVVFHPIWLINTIGLDQSVIDSIQMFKYRKEDGLIDETDSDCAVCLGSFQDDESLRLLPKCSHAFHVDCIDTWLRSHKNCPLCRAPVVNNNNNTSNNTTSNHHVDQNFVGTSAHEQIPFNVHQSSAQEIDTNCETGVMVQSDLSDHCSQKHEPMRRSVSLGSLCVVDQESEQFVVSQNPNVVSKTAKSRGSSSRLGVCSRATKSSSFGPRIDLGGF